MATIQPALAELERLYSLFLPRFLPATRGHQPHDQPVICIQSRGRKAALGWMAPKSWGQIHPTQAKDLHLNEITITAETLARSPTDIIGTLVHEMVHHFNAVDGVSDCNASQYHNRHFKTLAEAVGLTVEKAGNKGFATTRLGPDLVAALPSLNFDESAFRLFRLGRANQTKAPTKMKKWTCQCPVNIRCAVDLDATCQVCSEPFELQD